ncbi:MAG: hypothetical protein HYZ53_14780 [Planctomycetes bacterium]|nr:hypothetical protein [Planctomycetota bacterium]
MNDRIQCRLCGRWFINLASHLTLRHKMPPRGYKKRFGVHKLWADSLRLSAGSRAVDRGWGKTIWTDERVLDEIRARHRRKEPLAIAPLRESSLGLVAGAAKCFGSWSKALRAAGLDPSEHRLVAEPRPWSRELVLRGIRARARRKLPLHRRAMVREDRSLLRYADLLFGSWGHAITAAGLQYSKVLRRPPRVSPEDVVERILRRLREGKALNPSAVLVDDNHLYCAARSRFGSWRAALTAAGLPWRNHHKSCRALSPPLRRKAPAQESLHIFVHGSMPRGAGLRPAKRGPACAP